VGGDVIGIVTHPVIIHPPPPSCTPAANFHPISDGIVSVSSTTLASDVIIVPPPSGADYTGAHSDPLTELGPCCIIASLSLGAARLFKVKLGRLLFTCLF
jgi:hypothetical protein